MIFVGIDPGKKGAIAVIPEGFAVEIKIVPVPVITGNNSRPQYDVKAIADLLRGFSHGCFVTVERAQPLPPKIRGTIANFERGVSRGWEWMLTALGIPVQMVAPRRWQAAMFVGTAEGDTKQRAKVAVQRLFPSVDLRRTERSRKIDDGFCDALLLAEYGRRIHSKGENL